MDVDGTISEYAKTVLRHRSDTAHTAHRSRSDNLQHRGSKAVLSALRALQTKIAAMNAEHTEYRIRSDSKHKQLKHDNQSLRDANDKCDSQNKQLIQLNEKLTANLHESAQRESKALAMAQSAEKKQMAHDERARHAVQVLEHKVAKLQSASSQQQQSRASVAVYVEHIEKSKGNIRLLKREVLRLRSANESVTQQKQQSERFVAETLTENERLHAKVLSLQKAQVRATRTTRARRKSQREAEVDSIDINIMLSPRANGATKARTIHRSRSARSVTVAPRRKAKKSRKKKPFLPTGSVRKSFEKQRQSQTHCGKAQKRSRTKGARRSRKARNQGSPVKLMMPKSSLRMHGGAAHEMVHVVDRADSLFDGLDIDDVLLG